MSKGHCSKEDIQIIRCSTSLVTREVQITTIMRYHFIPTRIVIIKTLAGEDVEKLKFLYIVVRM